MGTKSPDKSMETTVSTRKRLSKSCLHLLAGVFQLLDANRDGLLDAYECRTFLVAASVAPLDDVLETLEARVPAVWRHKGYDFDTIVTYVEEYGLSGGVTQEELELMFGDYETNWSLDPSFLTVATKPRTPASDGAHGGKEVLPTRTQKGCIPAYSLRHILAGIPTAERSQLTDGEVDTIFELLGIKSERQRVDYVEAMRKLGEGYVAVK